MFLEDGKLQEKICAEKYKRYSQQTKDTELKQLFTKLAGGEQHHYDIINQMLQGQQPNLAHNQQAQKPLTQGTSKGATNNQHDKMLCSDLLST